MGKQECWRIVKKDGYLLRRVNIHSQPGNTCQTHCWKAGLCQKSQLLHRMHLQEKMADKYHLKAGSKLQAHPLV